MVLRSSRGERMEGVFYQEEKFLPTRASLLARIKDLSQTESWREFFDTYWKLIYNTCRRRGLSETEAEEVVQDTMISISRNIPDFDYDPKKGMFKTWLMNLIIWRIIDQLAKRKAYQSIEELQDTLAAAVEEDWEVDWDKNLISSAIERVKARTKPEHFQIFTMCVLQEKGAAETAKILKVSAARVYLLKHRISKAIANELKMLKKQQNYENSREGVRL
jgi:RNA polymerase sigma factor (sigma-70 family)